MKKVHNLARNPNDYFHPFSKMNKVQSSLLEGAQEELMEHIVLT